MLILSHQCHISKHRIGNRWMGKISSLKWNPAPHGGDKAEQNHPECLLCLHFICVKFKMYWCRKRKRELIFMKWLLCARPILNYLIIKSYEGDQPRWQNWKTLNSPPLTSTPKSQLSSEQPSVKNIRTYQKRSSTTKDRKKELQRDGQERQTHDTLNPILPVGDPQTGE